MTDMIEPVRELIDVETGEALPATVSNAARVIVVARAMKARVNQIVNDATEYLVGESIHQGTKTLHADGETVTISGGSTVDYDPTDLLEALREAGCPEERLNQAVITEISYKVDRAVLRQLAAANPDYRAAIESAELEVDRPYRASVKLRSNRA